MLLALYAQAAFPRCFRCARIRWRASWAATLRRIGAVAAALVQAHLADAILTTDYETTAWLRFTQPGLKVMQVNEPQRYPDAPAPPPALLKGRLIYLAELRRDQHPLVQQSFAYTGLSHPAPDPVRPLHALPGRATPKVPRSDGCLRQPETKKPRGAGLWKKSGHPRRAVEGAGGVPDRTSARVR